MAQQDAAAQQDIAMADTASEPDPVSVTPAPVPAPIVGAEAAAEAEMFEAEAELEVTGEFESTAAHGGSRMQLFAADPATEASDLTGLAVEKAEAEVRLLPRGQKRRRGEVAISDDEPGSAEAVGAGSSAAVRRSISRSSSRLNPAVTPGGGSPVPTPATGSRSSPRLRLAEDTGAASGSPPPPRQASGSRLGPAVTAGSGAPQDGSEDVVVGDAAVPSPRQLRGVSTQEQDDAVRGSGQRSGVGDGSVVAAVRKSSRLNQPLQQESGGKWEASEAAAVTPTGGTSAAVIPAAVTPAGVSPAAVSPAAAASGGGGVLPPSSATGLCFHAKVSLRLYAGLPAEVDGVPVHRGGKGHADSRWE